MNGINGGNATVGTISPSGLYKAPATVPAIGVSVTAFSTINPASMGSARVVVVSAGHGRTFYVATTGKDTNPGSNVFPWRTIQHAANSVQPGDTVAIHGGVYNEQVHISTSGSSLGGFIAFQSVPGEVATVDGTGLSPNGQSGLIDIKSRNFLIIRGLEIRNFKTASPDQVPIGIFISGAGTCLEILNNHIHNIVTSVKGSSGNAFGLAVYGSVGGPNTINNLIVSGNEIDHLITGSSSP